MNLVSRALRLLAAAVLAAAACAAGAADFVLHLAPDGNDTRDGRAPERAVATLARALALAQQQAPAGADVQLRFARVPWGKAQLDIDWVPGDGRRLVLDGGAGGERAVFDGGASGATWLQVRGQPEQRTNVTVRGFVVRGYRQAIVFQADWRDPRPWMSGNVVEDNTFERIGQFTPGVKPALAALHLLNTSRSRIVGNRFVDIRNLEGCDGLHAIYLAGGSSGNRIEGNVFDGGCGDTIKTRDRANDNVVVRNRFLAQTGKALLVDSFCDARKEAACKGKPQECPSWNNSFEDNFVDDASRQAVRAVVRTVGAGNIPACPLPSAAPQRIQSR